MANRDFVLEFLDEIRPNEFCDDCISNQLNIRPRQQINQICRGLYEQGILQRHDAVCGSCKKEKMVNSILTSMVAWESGSAPRVYDRPRPLGKMAYPDMDMENSVLIEKLRTRIVQICRKLWAKQKSEEPPRSISAIINILRDEKLIPSHQANMMLTTCGLRNVHVYENLDLGHRETTIASQAWSIISDWWDTLEAK